MVRERALLNLLSNPPMQPCSTKAQRKEEVHSKRKEERQKCALSRMKKSTGLHKKPLKHPKMYPPSLAELRRLFVLCTLTHNSGAPKLWMVRCSENRSRHGVADRSNKSLISILWRKGKSHQQLHVWLQQVAHYVCQQDSTTRKATECPETGH